MIYLILFLVKIGDPYVFKTSRGRSVITCWMDSQQLESGIGKWKGGWWWGCISYTCRPEGTTSTLNQVKSHFYWIFFLSSPFIVRCFEFLRKERHIHFCWLLTWFSHQLEAELSSNANNDVMWQDRGQDFSFPHLSLSNYYPFSPLLVTPTDLLLTLLFEVF